MYTVKRLAQAAQLWKDSFFAMKLSFVAGRKLVNFIEQFNDVPDEVSNTDLLKAFKDLNVNSGPFRYADSFEDIVLASSKFEDQHWEQFTFQYEESNTIAHTALSDLNVLPFNIWQWSRTSRRVFHLHESTQLFLEATALGDTCWDDIVFPFDHFFVSLDNPIQGKNFLYDGIMVNMNDYRKIGLFDVPEEEKYGLPEKVLELTLFPRELGNYHLVPSNGRKIFAQSLKKNQIGRLGLMWANTIPRMSTRPRLGRLMLPLDWLSDKPISMSLTEVFQEEKVVEALGTPADNPMYDLFTRQSREDAMKIVLGMCLYLQCLEAGNANVVTRTPPQLPSLGLDERCITKSSEFYDVHLCPSVLTEEEKSLLKTDPDIRRAYREMGFHWRRAHMRFAPGMKAIPGAKKTVKVKACRVRAEKEPIYGLAAGSRQVIKK